MVSSALTQRYASALIELAKENKALPKVEADLASLKTMLSESEDFAFFIAADSISAKRQQAVLADLAKKAKFQTITLNYLNVLAGNGRLSLLSHMIKAVEKMLAAERNEAVAKVETANALTAAQQKELAKALSDATGQNIILDARVDESLIGGLVVTIGSKRIDDSVSGRLDRLKTTMSKRTLNNTNDNVETLNKKKEA
ncbi:MAG: ATP synthase F1 subunit delta [Alphaproteobacteria bacterium]|nr:ATP synthase F1 subunit delta [Alphaproteobacteria bacterium]HCQ71677.1 ATP synthase F1 subunit delta [Rhodospirillaceae bacterium]|tara:strand:- start:39040 stop:39636 length:597 start_codon:yes stop_codon:yes gene_type:complete